MKKIIDELGQEKSSGLDRFPMFLFRQFLEIIKEDIMKLMLELYKGCARLDRLNYAKIILIEKNGGS